MVCKISCFVSGIFIISMIYFYNIRSDNVEQYKNSLPTDLQKLYDKLSKERLWISYYGYMLGAVLSLCFIFYNFSIKGAKDKKFGNTSVVCIVIIISFLTNYFYYILSPKSDWMLNHTNDAGQVKAWLQMYRERQYHYHLGFVFGLIAMGVLAFAFRCF